MDMLEKEIMRTSVSVCVTHPDVVKIAYGTQRAHWFIHSKCYMRVPIVWVSSNPLSDLLYHSMRVPSRVYNKLRINYGGRQIV